MNEIDRTIHEIRKFNRFYTVNMGFLDSGYLDTEYSIAETRILFEIKMHEKCIQSDIVKTLHIDKSYLSRLVKGFYKNGLIEKDKSEEDKRVTYLSMTEKGSAETERLIELTNHQIKAKINKLSLDECNRLCDAMHTVISILGKEERNEGYYI
ncbi:MarR family winged helix-turn-helix transcriptional regulator [Petralouisia muris]|uniref:MarR family winged helix-turn-helix transcriptional regulator n=1 Tax=Petralouisia muris TaxID=3032872 RepID=UPI0014420425|nr:MarR family winged helix-turn-helix transcriptional regulator [Petralouisia muris]